MLLQYKSRSQYSYYTSCLYRWGTKSHWQIFPNLQNLLNFIHLPGKPESHQDLASIRKGGKKKKHIQNIFPAVVWITAWLNRWWKAASPFPMWAPQQRGPIPKHSSSYHLHRVRQELRNTQENEHSNLKMQTSSGVRKQYFVLATFRNIITLLEALWLVMPLAYWDATAHQSDKRFLGAVY